MTITFRDAGTDRLTSDGNGPYVDDVDGNLRIRSDGVLLWNEPREFLIDFGDPVPGTAGCATSSTCRRNFASAGTSVGALRVLTGEDNTHELDGHLLAMSDGETRPAMLKTDLHADGANFKPRFQRPIADHPLNPEIAAESSFLSITRTGNTWTIEAKSTGLGGGATDDWMILISEWSEGRGKKKQSGIEDEGSFHVPFQMTVACPSCPPPPGP